VCFDANRPHRQILPAAASDKLVAERLVHATEMQKQALETLQRLRVMYTPPPAQSLERFDDDILFLL
jgi:hypothetical protein